MQILSQGEDSVMNTQDNQINFGGESRINQEMFVRKVIECLQYSVIVGKQVKYFGRPVKLKVNKFKAGALSSQEEQTDENTQQMQREQEDADFSNKSGSKLRFEEFEDEANTNASLQDSDPKIILETFKNPLYNSKFKNQIKHFDEEPEEEDFNNNSKLIALGKDDDRQFSKEKIEFIKGTLLYEGEDPYYEKLVNRPEKGVVWGLGGELLRQQKNFFEKGKYPTVEQVICFLELEQGKDIICVDLQTECKRFDLPRYGIILSSFSCRHNYKIASNLLRAIKSLEIPEIQNKNFKISGRKDDEWMMVDFDDIAVHMFVEEAREEIDLEWKWRNPPSPEEVSEYEKIQRHKSRKTFFEPLDDY